MYPEYLDTAELRNISANLQKKLNERGDTIDVLIRKIIELERKVVQYESLAVCNTLNVEKPYVVIDNELVTFRGVSNSSRIIELMSEYHLETTRLCGDSKYNWVRLITFSYDIYQTHALQLIE